MVRIILLTSWAVFAFRLALGQGNTIIRNNTLDFFMSTTTLGVEQHIKNKISLQINLGYTYSENFGIYNARNLRGGVADLQVRKYISKTENPLSGFYAGFSVVHRFASYITDESYYMDTIYIHNHNIKASARYTSFGGILGYQWEILKGKLFWDNYVGICGRIGSGYQRYRHFAYYSLANSIVELYYSGVAPKFGTALCVAIR
jgi:hypothetical protein